MTQTLQKRTKMANIAGIVKQATGLVLAVDALGNERILRSGDSVLVR